MNVLVLTHFYASFGSFLATSLRYDINSFILMEIIVPKNRSFLTIVTINTLHEMDKRKVGRAKKKWDKNIEDNLEPPYNIRK